MGNNANAPALRRGHASSYRPTHPQIGACRQQFGCGKCGEQRSIEGRRKHRVRGYVCAGCAVTLGLAR